MKLIMKNAMIASNHQALYIQILAVSVLYQLSTNVPNAMAVAKNRNSIAIKRVEKSVFLRRSCIVCAKDLLSGGKNKVFFLLNTGQKPIKS